MRQYLYNILKRDTQSNDIRVKKDHWLDSFEIFHKQYIIIRTESYSSSVTEDNRYIAAITTPDFNNQENETICDLNTIIQFLYCNVILDYLY